MGDLLMTEEQIKHLEEHSEEFEDIFDRPVREYAAEYFYIPDIYYSLCSDLGIRPNTKESV
jgi:hypothetical protein